MRALLGKEELLVRALKDFHASSVLFLLREVWRVVSKVDWCSRVRVLGCFGGFVEGCGGGSFFKAKIEGWRKE